MTDKKNKEKFIKSFISVTSDNVENNLYYKFKNFFLLDAKTKGNLKKRIDFFISYYEIFTENLKTEEEKDKTFFKIYFKKVAMDTNIEIYIILSILFKQKIIDDKFFKNFFESMFSVDMISHICGTGKKLNNSDVTKCARDIFIETNGFLFSEQEDKNLSLNELKVFLNDFYLKRIKKFRNFNEPNWKQILSQIRYNEDNINKRIPTFFYLISTTLKKEKSNKKKDIKNVYILRDVISQDYYEFIIKKPEVDHILALKEEKLDHQSGTQINSIANLWMLSGATNKRLGKHNIKDKFEMLSNEAPDYTPTKNYFNKVVALEKEFMSRCDLDVLHDVEEFWAKINILILETWRTFYECNLKKGIKKIKEFHEDQINN